MSFADDAEILFQSTPPRRGRHEYGYDTDSRTAVSIHAPAKGATRGKPFGDLDHGIVSIHAPAKGATMGAVLFLSCSCCFNPRPREGGDLIQMKKI